MSSMLDAVRELVTPDLVARMSGHTGDSEAMVSKGFGAAIPVLLSSLAGKADDTSFMGQLAGIAAETAGDPNALTRLPQAGSAIDATSTTGRWLSSLFGSNLGGIIDGIARFAGVGKGSSAQLLSMAAPIVLGYIGRLMRSDNLGATGLADRLRREAPAFAAAVPSGLSSLLPGARIPAEAARAIKRDTAIAAAPVAAAASSNRGWAVPLLVAALAIGSLMWWNGRHHVQPPQTARVETQTSFELPKPAGTSGTLPAGTSGTMPTVAVPAPTTDWMTFDLIEFNNGSSTLTPASRERVGKIAAALAAHPGARIQVKGYTDANGNEAANVMLSRSRANAVKDALRVKGVDSDRIKAEGHGSESPVASNATEEGRAQNRRVIVVVTEQ